MADATMSSVDEFPLGDGLDVKVGDRVYPDRPPRPKNRLAEAVTLHREAVKASFHVRLAMQLWHRLPFAAYESSLPEAADALVKAYIDSLTAIHRLQDEVVQLVRSTCEANVEFHQEAGRTNKKAANEAVQAKIEEMMHRAGVPFDPPPNVLTAAVVAQPIVALHRVLLDALHGALRSFGEQFETALQHLVGQRLMGLIEWVGPNACRYHFFREIILQENDGFSTKTQATLDDDPGSEGDRTGVPRRRIGTRQITSGQTGRHIHRWSRHEHHVMHAIHTTIRNSRVVMPPNAKRLADSIPEWLYDFVHVIDGDIIRERIIESDYRQETWEDVKTRDVPIYGCEPAIVIDQFVLTGWGPREVTAEERRRTAVSEGTRWQGIARVASIEKWLWLSGAVATALGGLLLFRQSLLDPSQSRVTAGLLMLAGLGAVTQVVRAHCQTRKQHGRYQHYLAGILVAAGFMTAGTLFVFGARFGTVSDWLWGTGFLLFSAVGLRCTNRMLWPSPQGR